MLDTITTSARLRWVVPVLDKVGKVAQEPPTWAGWSALMAVAGGQRGRRAAARATACYAAAAVVANLLVKPVVRRPRPRRARKGGIGPVTSSFPSGHAATHLAFIVGATRELPVTFLPLAFSALAAHWSIVRSRGHHPTDVVFGGLLGLGVGLVVNRYWTSMAERNEGPVASALAAIEHRCLASTGTSVRTSERRASSTRRRPG